MEFRHVHDVTPAIGPDLPVYEGDPRPEIEPVPADGPWTTARIHLGTHTGTHIDAPAHRLGGGAMTVEDVPLDALVGTARVVEFVGDAIDEDDVRRAEPQRHERLVFKTRNSALWEETRFNPNFVGLTAGGAQALAEAGVRTVGIDYLSVEPYESAQKDGEVHRILLEAGVVIVEGLDLDAVPAGRYTLVCLPLKLAGADGAPARAVLLEE